MIAALVATLVTLSLTLSAAETMPNIVIILADDLGYPDIGVNGCGQGRLRHAGRSARLFSQSENHQMIRHSLKNRRLPAIPFIPSRHRSQSSLAPWRACPDSENRPV
jgi:hypothetical protein